MPTKQAKLQRKPWNGYPTTLAFRKSMPAPKRVKNASPARLARANKAVQAGILKSPLSAAIWSQHRRDELACAERKAGWLF
jgi:hypothetical protein